MLIAAYSGRALAQAACRAGYAARVADLFADTDTVASAESVVQVEGNPSTGFNAPSLTGALDELLRRPTARIGPDALVYGAGFEAEPDLLRRAQRVVRLAGNSPETVIAVKDPHGLAAACQDLGIPHPLIMHTPPPSGDWLLKTRGSAGGIGTHQFSGSMEPPPGSYWQRRVPGVALSLVFLADGHRSEIVGFTRQYIAPGRGTPFRFGGAVTSRPPARLAAALATCARDITTAFGLRGLNSLDFMVMGHDWWLIEVNPRPGATLDLFDSTEFPLFHAHVEAAGGRLLKPGTPGEDYRAVWIAYAETALRVPPAFVWPEQVFDRPRDGALIPEGDPVATVFAAASKPGTAFTRATDRAAALLSQLAARGPCS
jgi:predicted ATP-grasp superfamily ATP-dependent carboligase